MARSCCSSMGSLISTIQSPGEKAGLSLPGVSTGWGGGPVFGSIMLTAQPAVTPPCGIDNIGSFWVLRAQSGAQRGRNTCAHTRPLFLPHQATDSHGKWSGIYTAPSGEPQVDCVVIQILRAEVTQGVGHGVSTDWHLLFLL